MRAATVNAGKHFLAPNQASQFVPISVSSGQAVAGVDLFVQIGDGGAAAGGDDAGPTISGVDFGGTGIFSSNNTGVFVDSTPLLLGATTTTQSGTVAATGRLAMLAVSTVGFTTGRYDLILNPATTGPTAFPGVSTSLVNGWIQIAHPEAADFNEDGVVTAADLVAWRLGVGQAPATHKTGNADGDADVDGADFLIWQRQVGSGSPGVVATHAVPEPAGALMVLLGGVGLGWWRKSR